MRSDKPAPGLPSYEPSGNTGWLTWVLAIPLAAGLAWLAPYYQAVIQLGKFKKATLLLMLLYYLAACGGAYLAARLGKCRGYVGVLALALLFGLVGTGAAHYWAYRFFRSERRTALAKEYRRKLDQLEAEVRRASEAHERFLAIHSALGGRQDRRKQLELLRTKLQGSGGQEAREAIEKLLGDVDLSKAGMRREVEKLRQESQSLSRATDRSTKLRKELEALPAAPDLSLAAYAAGRSARWPWLQRNVGRGWIWAAWGVEALLLLACGLGGAGIVALRPFCERCNRFTSETLVYRRKDQDAAGLVAIQGARTVEALLEHAPVERPDGTTDVRYTVTRCKACGGAAHLTISAGNRGNEESAYRDLVESVPLAAAQLARLTDVQQGWRKEHGGGA